MSDTVWVNIRYALIALGVGIAVKYSRGILTEETATSLISPAVDVLIGVIMAGGSAIWGNYVRSGTKAVPVETAARADVPTVSAATGAIQR